jgi:hypothetical protein
MKEEEILADCNPGIDLSEIESQYLPFIEKLKEYRKSKSNSAPVTYTRPYHTDTFFTGDLLAYVSSKLLDAKIKSSKLFEEFKPIELLSHIHKTITTDKNTYKRISRDLHYKDEDEIKSFKIESYEGYDLQSAELSYIENLRKFLRDNPKVALNEVATSADIIAINRRLIEGDIRCIRCRSNIIKCFKYDWINRKVL